MLERQAPCAQYHIGRSEQEMGRDPGIENIVVCFYARVYAGVVVPTQ